jgi:zinc transport system substrate-binding protein
MKRIIYLFSLVALISCGTSKKEKEVKNETFKVVAVNYPLHYFAERIAGDFIQLDFPIPKDVDPAYWIPKEEALNVYQNADLILANGADYAKWMNNVSLPASRIINTSASVNDKLIEVQTGESHSHGADGEHVHTGFAFTTWLNFEIAQSQALAIKKALLNKLPENKDKIESNFAKLNDELKQLNASMKSIGQQLHDYGIIGSHPVYQYLSQAYHLHVHSVHFEPHEMPTHDQWHDFDHLVDHHKTTIMIWEDEPLQEMKDKLVQKDIKVVVFNPCGNQPAQGDFMSIMKTNIKTLSNISK